MNRAFLDQAGHFSTGDFRLNRDSTEQDTNERVITIACLLVLSVISFIPSASLSSPVIASDDWSLIVAQYAFNELRPVNLLNHRPLDMSLYYGLTSAFGLELEYFYLFNALILFLTSALIYALVKRLFPQHAWIASLTAFVSLVYPVDYTRTWLIMLYIRFWWLISLGAIWLLLDYVESGNKLKLTLALAGIAIPLAAYEGQFGVVATATILIALLARSKPVARRSILFVSIVCIGALFYLWRFQIQANIPAIRYYSAGSFQLNPSIIFERYVQGFQLFFKNWFDPLQIKFGLTNGQVVFGLVMYIAFLYLTTLLASNRAVPSPALSLKGKLPLLQSQLLLVLTGGVFWAAGYFPIIGLYSPSIGGPASRVNMFAVAGAALLVVSFVTFLSILLARTMPHIRLLVTILILPIIIIGVYVQLQVNIENRAAWENQKDIWNAVFKTVPNIRSEKGIVILIPGYRNLQFFESYPFSTAWEVDAGTKVLYNNPDLNGYTYYLDLNDTQFKFTKNGINPPGTERLIGYKRLVFVLYHSEDRTVDIVGNLEATLSLPFEITSYDPYENIVPVQPSTTKFRWLVE